MDAMHETLEGTPAHTLVPVAGTIAMVSGVVAAVGVVLLVAMFALMYAAPYEGAGLTVGLVNDICVAVQYALTIPIALALHRILTPHNPALMRVATVVGIVAMLAVVGLQLALIFGLLPFERQVLPVSLAMVGGVGSWLVITGFVARATERLPHSVLMSLLAVPYFGYPLWAFWLGSHLRHW